MLQEERNEQNSNILHIFAMPESWEPPRPPEAVG